MRLHRRQVHDRSTQTAIDHAGKQGMGQTHDVIEIDAAGLGPETWIRTGELCRRVQEMTHVVHQDVRRELGQRDGDFPRPHVVLEIVDRTTCSRVEFDVAKRSHVDNQN